MHHLRVSAGGLRRLLPASQPADLGPKSFPPAPDPRGAARRLCCRGHAVAIAAPAPPPRGLPAAPHRPRHRPLCHRPDLARRPDRRRPDAGLGRAAAGGRPRQLPWPQQRPPQLTTEPPDTTPASAGAAGSPRPAPAPAPASEPAAGQQHGPGGRPAAAAAPAPAPAGQHPAVHHGHFLHPGRPRKRAGWPGLCRGRGPGPDGDADRPTISSVHVPPPLHHHCLLPILPLHPHHPDPQAAGGDIRCLAAALVQPWPDVHRRCCCWDTKAGGCRFAGCPGAATERRQPKELGRRGGRGGERSDSSSSSSSGG